MINNMFSSVSDYSSEKFDGMKKASSDLIERHWTEIENILVSGLITISEDHLNDPKTLEDIFVSAHAVLPLPIRLVIKQKTFLRFCFENKEKIHNNLNSYKIERASKNINIGAAEKESNNNFLLENKPKEK